MFKKLMLCVLNISCRCDIFKNCSHKYDNQRAMIHFLASALRSLIRPSVAVGFEKDPTIFKDVGNGMA